MFSIYEGTGLQTKSKAKEKIVDENQYLTKINLLEQEIVNLKAEITVISKQNTIYNSRMRTFVRYGYTGYYPQGDMIEFLNQKIQELEDTVRQLQRTQNIEPEIVFSNFDNSPISVGEAENRSNLQREKVVYFDIPYEDDDILNWWNHLSPNWRHAFERKFVIPKPLTSVEELYRIFRAKSLKFIGADYPMSMGLGVALPFALEELSGLKILHDIEEINLSFNRITNIVGLLHLKKLRKLNLTHNKIKHIHHLNKLPALESLDLSSNPIDHQEVEDLKKTFPDVHIEFR